MTRLRKLLSQTKELDLEYTRNSVLKEPIGNVYLRHSCGVWLGEQKHSWYIDPIHRAHCIGLKVQGRCYPMIEGDRGPHKAAYPSCFPAW